MKKNILKKMSDYKINRLRKIVKNKNNQFWIGMIGAFIIYTTIIFTVPSQYFGTRRIFGKDISSIFLGTIWGSWIILLFIIGIIQQRIEERKKNM